MTSYSHTTPALPVTLRHASIAFATACLAACGGGGTDSPSAPTAQASEVAPLPDAMAASVDAGGEATTAIALRHRRSPAPAPAPEPAPAPAPAPTPAGFTCGLPDFQAAVLARINRYRAAGASCGSAGTFAAVPPLAWNAALAQAAAGHSQDMATYNYFSHTSRDGRSMVDRINAAGYLWSSIGENIAAGYPTTDAVIDGWMASDGHCANLMNPNFRDTGLACVANPDSTYKTYWTMDAGRPR